jgi:hypothetical protein
MATSAVAIPDLAVGGGLAAAFTLFSPLAAAGGRRVRGPSHVVPDLAGRFVDAILGEIALA